MEPGCSRGRMRELEKCPLRLTVVLTAAHCATPGTKPYKPCMRRWFRGSQQCRSAAFLVATLNLLTAARATADPMKSARSLFSRGKSTASTNTGTNNAPPLAPEPPQYPSSVAVDL